MTHERNKRYLAKKSGFATHIRTSQNNDLLTRRIQQSHRWQYIHRSAEGSFQLPGDDFLLVQVLVLRLITGFL